MDPAGNPMARDRFDLIEAAIMQLEDWLLAAEADARQRAARADAQQERMMDAMTMLMDQLASASGGSGVTTSIPGTHLQTPGRRNRMLRWRSGWVRSVSYQLYDSVCDAATHVPI